MIIFSISVSVVQLDCWDEPELPDDPDLGMGLTIGRDPTDFDDDITWEPDLAADTAFETDVKAVSDSVLDDLKE